MSWELYEVWSVDEHNHEELIDTTRSLKEAQEIASAALEDDSTTEAVIYRETEDGDLEEIERFN